MKKRLQNVILISKVILAAIIGFWLQLSLHEMGHAIFALITKNKILNVKLGVVSYVDVFLKNEADYIIISIGPYILLYIIWILMYFINSKKFFINMLRTVLFISTEIQLGINIVELIINKKVENYIEFDIGKFVYYSSYNKYIVCVISSLIIIITCVFEVKKIRKVYNEV